MEVIVFSYMQIALIDPFREAANYLHRRTLRRIVAA
jgi:hypothetical protein